MEGLDCRGLDLLNVESKLWVEAQDLVLGNSLGFFGGVRHELCSG